ncbi:uncharacterized protein EI90DRAFT_3016459 [Cantharellus anzutake]|uniref:uncharacterized protein n=1 Tax=Cantharellus anzutake TaxID=1750568 RepID=UPI001906BF33|nr:uncharacterized protein EI90DRAFT_3016459 [Cantharellus anzutake]KAF8331499.1 hypothetical protein EI90DRAFT_3016459 [Cantharellus anzutake]
MTVAIILGRRIDLPTSVFLHGLALAFYGLYLTFYPTSTPSRANDRSAMMGIAVTCLGLGYLGTAYMPQEQNAFLYASVPVRVGVAILSGLKLLLYGNTLGTAGKRDFLAVLIYDGIGGLILGWNLGTWSGIAPAYR